MEVFMISDIVTLLSLERTYSLYELAQHLKITPEAARAQIDFLCRTGYLKHLYVPENCSMKCTGCLRMGEKLQPSLTIWRLAK
jgi:hypothetical protein